MNHALKIIGLLSPLILAACGSAGAQLAKSAAESNPIVGPGVTTNPTVYSSALVCLKGNLSDDLVFAIGPIPDKTGKYIIEQDGAILSRAASDMAVSALSLAGAKQVDRLTAGIVEWELKFAGKKVLGDKGGDSIKTKDGTKQVAFRVIRPGVMLGSTHYITGSISELNWNYFSGGGELNVLGIGGGGRAFLLSVAMDLKLVNSRTSVIEDTVTFTKKVVGYETKAGIFRFFGMTLVDFNIGEKSQEPIQLALRSIVERSAYELLSRKAPAARKALCDNLLNFGDEQVDSAEKAPATKKPEIKEASAPIGADGEGEVANIGVGELIIPTNDEATKKAEAMPASGDDADLHDAWKAKRMGDGS